MNPQGVSTYLFLLKTSYPQFAFLGRDPQIEDLYKDNNINVNQCALPAFQLVLTAANQGMTQDQAIETVCAMYKVGGCCPLIPPPKKIDVYAKASALEEGKNAALMAADLHVNGPRRMAVTTKKGPGWTVDGEIDGVHQTGFSGNQYAYQPQISHHGGDVNEEARMYLHRTFMVPVPPIMGTPVGKAPGGCIQGPSNARGHSDVGQDETSGEGFSPFGHYSGNPDFINDLYEVNHFFANLPIAIILTFPKFSYYSYIPCHKNPHMWFDGSPLKPDLHTAKGTHQNNDSGAPACSTVTTGQVNNFAPNLSHSAQCKSQQASTSAPEEKVRKVPRYIKKVPQLHLPEDMIKLGVRKELSPTQKHGSDWDSAQTV